MTITSYPFESQDTTETQYQRIMGLYRVPGVVGAPGSTAMAASTPGGMTVRFAAGLVHCRGMVLDNDGAPTDNQRDVTVTAADPSARVDRIVARFDPANDSAYLHHLKGTAGSSTPPSLTRTATGVYDVRLYRVAVAGGAAGLGSGVLTDERDWVDVGLERWESADRPSSPGLYRTGHNLSSGRLEFWDGTGWRYFMDQRDAKGADTTLGRSIGGQTAPASLATGNGTVLGNVVATSTGQKVRIRADVACTNTSGATSSFAHRVLCDGVDVAGGAATQYVDAGGQAVSTWEWEHTPAAGSHTWSLAVAAAVQPAIRADKYTLTVVERG